MYRLTQENNSKIKNWEIRFENPTFLVSLIRVLLLLLIGLSFACKSTSPSISSPIEIIPKDTIISVFPANTLDSFFTANSNINFLQASRYDNAAYPYYYLEPGQIDVDTDTLRLRLENDIVTQQLFEAGNSLRIKLISWSGDSLSQLELNKETFTQTQSPYFYYRFPVNALTLQGKKLQLEYQILDEQKLIRQKTFNLACCDGKAWEAIGLATKQKLPAIDLPTDTFHYDGFTGVLDIQFPNNNTVIQNANETLNQVQAQLDKFRAIGYKVKEIEILGYASIKGDADLNQKLSEERAASVRKGLISLNPDLDPGAIQSQGLGEDWELSTQLIKDLLSDEEQLEKVNSIIQGAEKPDQREAALFNLQLPDGLMDQVLSATRHSIAKLTFTYPGQDVGLGYYPAPLPLADTQLYKIAIQAVELGPYSPNRDAALAMRQLDSLILSRPNPYLYAYRASYLAADNKIEAALSDLNQASSENLSLPLLEIYLHLQSAKPFPTEKRSQTEKIFTSWKQDRGAYQRGHIWHAWLHYKQGDLQKALVEMKKINPEYLDAYGLNLLGVLLLESQQLSAAQQVFSKALELDADYADPHFNLAAWAAYKGYRKQAVDHLKACQQKIDNVGSMIDGNPIFKYIQGSNLFDELDLED